MSIKDTLKSVLKGAESKGSAFARIAEHEAQVLAHKGKLVAINAATKAAQSAIDELEQLTNEAHKGLDKVAERLRNLDARL